MMSSHILLCGPASEALERVTKRRRTVICDKQAPPSTAFDLAAMFDSDSPETELSFPSISWDFYDEPESVQSPLLSEMKSVGKKRTLNGMVRSKAFVKLLHPTFLP
jgi:hypothetical protein